MASQGGGDGSTGSQVDAQHPEPLGLHRRAHCLLVASRSGSPPGMGGPHWSFLGFQNTFLVFLDSSGNLPMYSEGTRGTNNSSTFLTVRCETVWIKRSPGIPQFKPSLGRISALWSSEILWEYAQMCCSSILLDLGDLKVFGFTSLSSLKRYFSYFVIILLHLSYFPPFRVHISPC